VSVGTRLRVALHGARLDAELAAGADPASSEELFARAALLLRRRRAYARSLRRAIRGGTGVPVARAAVLEAAPALLALADDLDEVPAPDPRGVALTVQLLSDGGGPLYRPWAPGELYEAAEGARLAL